MSGILAISEALKINLTLQSIKCACIQHTKRQRPMTINNALIAIISEARLSSVILPSLLAMPLYHQQLVDLLMCSVIFPGSLQHNNLDDDAKATVRDAAHEGLALEL